MKSSLLAALLATVAVSAEAESTLLLDHRSWVVEHHYVAESGMQYCTAGTSSRSGTSFDLIAFDSGLLGVGLFDGTWRMPAGQTRTIIADVDYERWTAEAEVLTEGSGLMATIDADVAVEFLSDLRDSNAVSVYNEDMRRIATFSLAGSAAAIEKLIECWGRISAPVEDTDPFLGVGASADDPFL